MFAKKNVLFITIIYYCKVSESIKYREACQNYVNMGIIYVNMRHYSVDMQHIFRHVDILITLHVNYHFARYYIVFWL